LRHENRGPGYTQNRGIREAAAPLILLMADDIILAREALEAHVKAHTRHDDRHVAILGNVIQAPELRETAFQRSWDPFELRRLEQDQELPYSLFWACNISLNREFMLEHGMFRDAMGHAGPAAHEDVEVGHRLSRHGLRIFHEKVALGHHHHAESLETAIARSYQRGLNWDEVFQLMPHAELLIRQRLHGLGTLIVLRKELTGARRAYLLPGDRSVVRLAIEVVLRALLFNGVTVPCVWKPLMRLAERNSLAEALIRPRFYRGVIVYYFRKACRDVRSGKAVGADSAPPSLETPTGAERHVEPGSPLSRRIAALLNLGALTHVFGNFAALSLVQLANYVLPLVIVPFLLTTIGTDGYGRMVFAQSFAAYFVLLTAYGFNLSATRDIALNRDDGPAASRIFSDVLASKLLLFLLSAAVAAACVLVWPRLRTDWLLYACAFGQVLGEALMPTWYFQGVERMRIIAALTLATKLLFTASVFVFIRNPGDYTLAALLNSLSFVVTGTVGLTMVLTRGDVSLRMPRLRDLSRQYRAGWPIFFSTAWISAYTTTRVFAVGILTSSTLTAYFSVAEKLAGTIQVFPLASLVQATYPRLSMIYAQSAAEALRMAERFQRFATLAYLVIAPLAALLVPFVIDRYVTPLPPGAASTFRLLMVASLVVNSNPFRLQYLLVAGRSNLYLRIHLLAGILGCAGVLAGTYLWSIGGTALASICVEVFVLLMTIRAVRSMERAQ
jgi:PST family polysaccharide transporter